MPAQAGRDWKVRRRCWCELTIGPGGRVVIPAAFRKALEVNEGDYIVMHMDGEELRVVNDEKEFERAREVLAKYVPEGVSLVDELIADRRREAAAEEAV